MLTANEVQAIRDEWERGRVLGSWFDAEIGALLDHVAEVDAQVVPLARLVAGMRLVELMNDGMTIDEARDVRMLCARVAGMTEE